MNETEKAREKALTFHDHSASSFDSKYEEMAQDNYASSFAYGRKKLMALLSETLADLPKDSTIVDIGCGTGEQVRWCRELGFSVIGVEPSGQMRAIAQKNNPGASILDGTITRLPFEDASVDFLLAIEVLRYFGNADIQRGYQEMVRVLKPGGRMFFTMLNLFALDGYCLFDKLRGLRFRLAGRERQLHDEFVTPWRVRRDLLGLNVSHVATYGRMFAPLRIAYKTHPSLGAKTARILESFDDALAKQPWMTPFSGHLVVVAKHA